MFRSLIVLVFLATVVLSEARPFLDDLVIVQWIPVNGPPPPMAIQPPPPARVRALDPTIFNTMKVFNLMAVGLLIVRYYLLRNANLEQEFLIIHIGLMLYFVKFVISIFLHGIF